MDPQACLDILAKATREHSLASDVSCGCGVLGRTRLCHLGSNCSIAAETDHTSQNSVTDRVRPFAVPLVSEVPPPPTPEFSRYAAASAAAAAAGGAGQVIDLESG